MKKFFLFLAVLVAVVLVAAVTIPLAFRGKITQIVKREANEMLRAQLDFEKLDISLLRHFPNASLQLKGLTLVGQDRFAGDTIASVERISVVVDLWSIFGDEGFEVSKLFVVRPTVRAHKLADGSVNWDVVKASDQSSEVAAEPSEPSSFRLQMRNLRITDAVVHYRDDSTGIRFSASPLSLRLRGDMSAAQTDLDLRLSAERIRIASGGMTLLSGAEAEIDAIITADLETNRFTFTRNTLRLNAIELGVDGWVELRDGSVAMDLKAACEQVQFKDVLSLIPAFYTRDFRNLSASGELAMSLWARGEMSGATLPAFELKLGVTQGGFRYSSRPKAVTDINLTAKVSNPGGVMDRTVVDIPQFGLKMASNSVTASLHATNLISNPTFRVEAAGRVDLGQIRDVYPLAKGVELDGLFVADLKVAGQMSDIEGQRYERMKASGTFVVEGFDAHLTGLPAVHIHRAAATITPLAMTLGDFGATIGGSDLTAYGQLTGYIGYFLRDGMLSGRLYVKSEMLDLNEILGESTASDSSEGTAAMSTESSAADADAASVKAVEVPRNLNLSLNTELHKVLFQKMTIASLAGEMRVAEGCLSLEHLKMQVFGGSATASGSYSMGSDPQHPELTLQAGIEGASFAKTFEQLDVVQKLVPVFAKTGGDYSLSIDLRTRLDAQLSPDLQTLDATGEIRSANIRVQNLDVFDALAKTLGNDALKRIDAKDVAIRFAIREGRIQTQPFDLTLGNVVINLAGSTGLDQTIDYAAVVSLPESLTAGLLSKVSLRIGGTFSAPKITLGAKEAAQEVVKNAIDQQIEKLTGSKSLSDEVQKQVARLREEAQRAGDKLVEAAQSQRAKIVETAASKGALAKIAAEKAGDKLVDEARRQAEKLKVETEKQIDKLTAKAS